MKKNKKKEKVTDAGCFSSTISSAMVYFDTLSHDFNTDLNSEFLLETNINIKMFRLNLTICEHKTLI